MLIIFVFVLRGKRYDIKNDDAKVDDNDMMIYRISIRGFDQDADDLMMIWPIMSVDSFNIRSRVHNKKLKRVQYIMHS